MPNSPDSQFIGSYIPQTYPMDVSEIYTVDASSPAFKELIVRLYQNLNNIAIAVNNKDTGLYTTSEFVSSQQWYPNPALNSGTTQTATLRNVFRKVIPFGTLPNTGTKSVAHGITFTANAQLTRLYGAATDPVGLTYIPLPYASPTAANNIELYANNTNIVVITGSNRSNYTACDIIIEYIKY